jgi:hypothetical protein
MGRHDSKFPRDAKRNDAGTQSVQGTGDNRASLAKGLEISAIRLAMEDGKGDKLAMITARQTGTA